MSSQSAHNLKKGRLPPLRESGFLKKNFQPEAYYHSPISLKRRAGSTTIYITSFSKVLRKSMSFLKGPFPSLMRTLQGAFMDFHHNFSGLDKKGILGLTEIMGSLLDMAKKRSAKDGRKHQNTHS